jgi:hypothetical protein
VQPDLTLKPTLQNNPNEFSAWQNLNSFAAQLLGYDVDGLTIFTLW